MTKRILSLLLVTVVMFTTLAFELPVGVNAGKEVSNIAYGWYGRSLYDEHIQYSDRRHNLKTTEWNSTEKSCFLYSITNYGSDISSAPALTIPIRYTGLKSNAYDYIVIVYRYPTSNDNPHNKRNSRASYTPHLYLSSTDVCANAGSTNNASDWYSWSGHNANTSGGYTTTVKEMKNSSAGCSQSFYYRYAVVDISSWSFSGAYFGELIYLPFGLEGAANDCVYIDSITFCTNSTDAHEIGNTRINPYEDSHKGLYNEDCSPHDGKYYVQNYRYAWYDMYDGFAYGSAPSSITVDENGSPDSTGRQTSPNASLNSTVTSSKVSNGDILYSNSLYTDEDTWTFTWSGLPTRDYYDFVGWYYYRYVAKGPILKTHSEAGKQLLKGFLPKTSDNNYTLTMDGVDDSHVEPRIYAAWTPTNYTITYNLNGGTNHPSNPSSYTYESGSYTLQNPTKAGYTFAGWTCGSSSYSTTINNSYMGSRTYTANWVADNVTVTWYDENGTSVLHTDTISAGSKVPDYDGTTPTKTGDAQYSYTFSHWQPLSGVAVGGTANSSVAFKAVYTQTVNEYTVKFLNHDGTELQVKSYKYGETPSYNGTPVKAEDAGYTYQFSGWSPNVATVTGTATFTALFTPIPKVFTITYDLAGGTVSGANPTSYTIESSDITLINPTKAGYVFIGWTGSNGDTPETSVTIAKGSTGNKSYTANWEAIDYTITYDPQNGNAQFNENYTINSEHSLASAPEKTGYTFAGWIVSNVPDGTVGWNLNKVYEEVPAGAYGNVNLTANWTANVYTVTWVDDDGNVLKTDSVKYGKTPSYSGDTPEKSETDTHTYVWTGGWDTEVSAVEGDITYTATFTPIPKSFNITYVNGSESETVPYTVGDSSAIKAAPEKTGYTFGGWKATAGDVHNWGDSVYAAGSVIDGAKYGDVTLAAQWSAINYTITYKPENGDADTVVEYTIENGITVASEPTRVGHTFKGWAIEPSGNWEDKTYSSEEELSAGLYGNVTFTAQWEINKYTVIWKNSDGTILETDTDVPYGTEPSFDGETPTKESDDHYHYTFAGWNETPAAVTEDTTYIATYDAIFRGHVVTYLNEDGTVLQKITDVQNGSAVPEYTGEAPKKDSTVENSYEFIGWHPVYDENAVVNGDMIFTAEYRETARIYTITWHDTDKSVIYSEGVVFGARPNYNGKEPQKESTEQYIFTFNGWETIDGNDIENVCADADYYPKFREELRKYDVTWKNWNGSEIKTDRVPYGTMPEYNGDTPEKSVIGYTSTFDGWTPDVVTVTGDAVYTATFKDVAIEYTLTYIFDSGFASNEGSYTITYTISDAITLPTLERTGFSFNGWTVSEPEGKWTEITSIDPITTGFEPNVYYGDATLTAVWIEQLITITYEALENGSVTLGSEQVSLVGGTPCGSTAVPDTDYKFVGWFADPECTVLVDSNELFVPTNEGVDKTYYAKFELAIADLIISVSGTQTIDENQSYIFDIVKPDDTTLTVAVHGNCSVTVKDVPVGSYTVSEKDGWSYRYVSEGGNTQIVELTATPDPKDESKDNTAYFTEKRVEKPTEQALWLGGDSYRKNKYGPYVPINDDPENDEND